MQGAVVDGPRLPQLLPLERPNCQEPSESLPALRNAQGALSSLPAFLSGTDLLGNTWGQADRVELKPRLGCCGDVSFPGSESDPHQQVSPGFPWGGAEH